MFGDLHIHMILDGVYYRAAIDAQKEHPLDGLVRARLSDYQARGVCLLRDGGDAWGVSLRARELAGEYGIDYRSPAFPIYRRGHYGAFIGRGFDTEDEYRALLDGHFGAASAADLGLTDLKRLMLVMADYGFKPTKGNARRGVSRKKTIPATLANDDANLGREALMRKIEAQLAEKGRAEGTDVPWGYAVAILKRQSGGVTRCFEHATPEQLRGVIAALTYDAKRKGRYAGSWGE